MTADPVLTVAEVAQELRISRSHAHHLLKGDVEGVAPIPYLRLGKRKRIVMRSRLEKWKSENVSCSIATKGESQ